MSYSTHLTASLSNAMQSLASPRFWGVVIGIVFICTLSGPFGTGDVFPISIKTIYWTVIVAVSAFLGTWAHFLAIAFRLRTFGQIALLCVLFGFVIAAWVTAFSFALLSPIAKMPSVWSLVLYSYPSAAVILSLTFLLSPDNRDASGRPPLFKRLKKHRSATSILALSAQDHYVEVVTELGSELILMRLSDAITEMAPLDGLQIHRSHWVANTAVDHIVKDGRQSAVRLTNGTELPVSQSKITQLRAVVGA